MRLNIRFLTISQLAELTSLARETVRKRLGDLEPVKGEGNTYRYDTHLALPRLYKAPGTKQEIDKAMAEESLLLERARREKIELDVKRMRGEYVSIEETCKAVEKEYSFVRSQLRSLPSKLAKPLSIIMDPHVVQTTIEEAINECLEELVADQKYEEILDEVEWSRASTDSKPEKDAETVSEVESSGVGGHISVSEPGE